MIFDDCDIFPAFEKLLRDHKYEFEQSKENPELFCYATHQKGKLLIVDCFKEEDIGKAVAILISADSVDEMPSFNMLYAVSPDYRNQGLGTRIVETTIKQFQIDFSNAEITPKLPGMFITTYVDVNNLVSQKISRRFISKTPTTIKDSISGKPQFFYKRFIKFD